MTVSPWSPPDPLPDLEGEEPPVTLESDLAETCCPYCMHDWYGKKPDRVCHECGFKEGMDPKTYDYTKHGS